MQGKDTDAEDVAKIREALEGGTTYCGRLLNYKKDGTPFWNLLTIAPIKDETGKVLKYIGYVTLPHLFCNFIYVSCIFRLFHKIKLQISLQIFVNRACHI